MTTPRTTAVVRAGSEFNAPVVERVVSQGRDLVERWTNSGTWGAEDFEGFGFVSILSPLSPACFPCLALLLSLTGGPETQDFGSPNCLHATGPGQLGSLGWRIWVTVKRDAVVNPHRFHS